MRAGGMHFLTYPKEKLSFNYQKAKCSLALHWGRVAMHVEGKRSDEKANPDS